MMIEETKDSDLDSIRQLIEQTVHSCIDVEDDVLPVLLKDIRQDFPNAKLEIQ